MKILIHSDPPWMPTGYGIQTRLLAEGLIEAGHQVEVAAKSGLAGTSVCWAADRSPANAQNNVRLQSPAAGIWVHPYAWTATPSAGDGFPSTVRRVDPDLIITLCDVWALDRDGWQMVVGDIPVWSWVPVERDPLLDPVTDWVTSRWVTRVIPMSPFGYHLLKPVAAGKVTGPIGHGYDPDVFRADRSKREARASFGLPEKGGLFGTVAANVGDPFLPRKGWPQLFKAWRHRIDQVGQPGHLLIHSNPTVNEGGVNLHQMAASLGLHRTDTLIFTTAGLSAGRLADLYTAMDVFVLPTLGEGFGVPIVEAQACGTPAIVSGWSGCSHLVPDHRQIRLQDSIPVWSMGSWMRIADPIAVADLMTQVLAEPCDPRKVAEPVTRFAKQQVTKQWVTLIKEAFDG